MATAQLINCVVCDQPVRPRQQGVQCDCCLRWNHRVCDTGISQEAYRAAVRDGSDINWHCALCAKSMVSDSPLPASPPPSSPLPASPLLFSSPQSTSLNVRMVSEKKLRRVQRRRYREIQAKVFSLWAQNEEGKKTARQLLKACSLFVGPRGM